MYDDVGRLTEVAVDTMMALQTTPTLSETAAEASEASEASEQTAAGSEASSSAYPAQLSSNSASDSSPSALCLLPRGGWGAVPNLPKLLEALPVSCQEHIASQLWQCTDNFKVWFPKSHGAYPERNEHPQFWMTRISFFHVKLTGKFRAGDVVALTLHDASSRQMVTHADLEGENRSVFIMNKGRDTAKWSSKRARAAAEGDEGGEGEVAMPVDMETGGVIDVNPEPGTRQDIYYLPVNDKGFGIMRAYFGFTSRQTIQLPGTAVPFVIRAERLRAHPDDDHRVAWTKPFIINARQENDSKRTAANRLAGFASAVVVHSSPTPPAPAPSPQPGSPTAK